MPGTPDAQDTEQDLPDRGEHEEKLWLIKSDEWRRSIYTAIHAGIHSNERILVQIGTAAIAGLAALYATIAFRLEFAEELTRPLALLALMPALCAVVWNILHEIADRITEAFLRLSKIETFATVYDVPGLLPDQWFDRRFMDPPKRPATYRTFRNTVISIGVLSILTAGYFLYRIDGSSQSELTACEGSADVLCQTPKSDISLPVMSFAIQQMVTTDAPSGGPVHVMSEPKVGRVSSEKDPFAAFFARCVPGPVTTLVEGHEATDVLIQFTCRTGDQDVGKRMRDTKAH